MLGFHSLFKLDINSAIEITISVSSLSVVIFCPCGHIPQIISHAPIIQVDEKIIRIFVYILSIVARSLSLSLSLCVSLGLRGRGERALRSAS